MHNLVYRGRTGSARIISPALQQALQSWDGLLEWLPVGVCICDRDGLVVQYNRRAAEMWGRAPVPGDVQLHYCGSPMVLTPDGAAVLPADLPMGQVLRSGQPVRDRELIIARRDGTRITVLVNTDPLYDHDGEIIGGVSCYQDISERKRSEELLRDSTQRFRTLLDALPAAIYTTDANGHITYYNEAAVELWGCRPALDSDRWCGSWRLFLPDGTPLPHDQCPMAVALKENRPVRGVEAVAERPDGTRVPFMPFPTPLRDASGALVGAVNMLVDITERKRADDCEQALLDELNHRVNNTLATVQALAGMTMRGAGVPAEARQAFEARLLALGHTHDRLAGAQWGSADLHTILSDVLAPFCQRPDQARLEGAPVRLAPQQALPLAMVLHELAANAATYGALSAGGTVSVSWSLGRSGADARLRIRWQEAGGPPVRAPERRGFGSRLIERGVVRQLGGTVELLFKPAGVRCMLDIPLPPRSQAG